MIQKVKLVYQVRQINLRNLRNYEEDICDFFRHDALYKVIDSLPDLEIDKIMRQFK